MAWRGTTTVWDRLFSSLAYLIPLYSAVGFGIYFFSQFPQAALPFMLLVLPVGQVYNVLFGFGRLIVLIILFAAVVRNEGVKHFIRFNVMQAILIDIIFLLFGLVFSLPLRGVLPDFFLAVLYNTLFLGGLVTTGYAVVQCVRGLYAEIPFISEATYLQVR